MTEPMVLLTAGPFGWTAAAWHGDKALAMATAADPTLAYARLADHLAAQVVTFEGMRDGKLDSTGAPPPDLEYHCTGSQLATHIYIKGAAHGDGSLCGRAEMGGDERRIRTEVCKRCQSYVATHGWTLP